MITMREPVAPPHPRQRQPWMPAMFDLDAQGLPVRHRSGQRLHGDVWEARCGVWLFNFLPLTETMRLAPCPTCKGFEP